jgi:hypothetical protein
MATFVVAQTIEKLRGTPMMLSVWNVAATEGAASRVLAYEPAKPLQGQFLLVGQKQHPLDCDTAIADIAASAPDLDRAI